ncbi:MAG: hypothetical protein F6K11_04315 [Leptolyngbya sp. SIO3F4]|nr:hypothetical protein [Leptolyngbya sp. SIO3F4]
MGVTSGVNVAQADSLALMVTDGNSPLLVSAAHGDNGDPADGFIGRGSPNRRISGGSRIACTIIDRPHITH